MEVIKNGVDAMETPTEMPQGKLKVKLSYNQQCLFWLDTPQRRVLKRDIWTSTFIIALTPKWPRGEALKVSINDKDDKDVRVAMCLS